MLLLPTDSYPEEHEHKYSVEWGSPAQSLAAGNHKYLVFISHWCNRVSHLLEWMLVWMSVRQIVKQVVPNLGESVTLSSYHSCPPEQSAMGYFSEIAAAVALNTTEKN